MNLEFRLRALRSALPRRWRSSRSWSGAGIAIIAVGALTVTFSLSAFAALPGLIGQAAQFEDNDGNLAVDNTGYTDWNSFSGGTYTGTAPYQTKNTTANGWSFIGLTDASKSNTDTGFKGGTKQDDNCPGVIGTSSPNKDDLKRIYIATKSVTGFPSPNTTHVFLELAWVRIAQNTTSPSAHVGFEINQSKTACGAASDGLVQRTAGDLLFVYDFEGSSTSNPSLTFRRWVTSATSTCEIGSDSPPCWGTATNLSASGFAETKVNTFGSVLDTAGPAANPPGETLGTNEFGEAGADLTNDGIFTSSGPCLSFGQTEGVSRSSGNSGSAAMEDLVGPGLFELSNCGEVVIKKHTDPRGVDKNFSYSTDIPSAGTNAATFSKAVDSTGPPTTFTLNDSGNTTGDNSVNTEDITNVKPGSYTVNETLPGGWLLESLVCTTGGAQDATTPTQADITVAQGATVTCTYTNQQQLGAIKISKISSKPAATALSGAHFELCTNNGPYTVANPCAPAKTGSDDLVSGTDGSVCVDNLGFATYYVTEKAAPTGYSIDDATTHSVAVSHKAKCSDTSFGGESLTFKDTPLTDLTITVTSEATGGTKSRITCVDSASADIGNSPQPSATTFGDPENVTANGLKPGTYTCTVIIDP